MRFLIVDSGGHLTNQCGEEFTDLCIVLLEELLSCGCCLFNGADGGVGGLLYGVYYGVCSLGGVGLYRVGDSGQPCEECRACNSVLPCYG